MPQLLSGLLFLLLAAFGPLGPGQKDDSPLALFKKYWSQYKDNPANQKEAVLTLENVDDPGVFDVLYAKLGDKTLHPDVVNAIVRVFVTFKNEAQQKQLYDALKAEKAEKSRVALLQVITQGKFKDPGGVLTSLLGDKSWEVRRWVLEALLANNDPAATASVLTLCEDPEPAVKCKAIDALTAFKAEAVVPKAIAVLNDPVRQVRQSAIHALTVIRHRSAVEPLIQRLAKEEGVLILDIAEALANLTGKEFGPKIEEWNKWWGEQDKEKYVLPTAEGIAYLRTRHSTKSGTAGGWEIPKEKVGGKFFGTETPSKTMIFVIDCSGSMEALVTEKERFEAGNYPDYSRMEIVKTELSRTIERLEPYVKFNIISFATRVRPWKDKLQQASITVKSSAKDWVKTLTAIGGASKEDLASVGLTASANLDEGKTNTFDALKTALGVNDVRTGDAGYAKIEADTIFFLSDGRPTVGQYVDPDDILREIKALNDLRKVVIHTIAIGEFQKDFMQRLAEQNGGVFVDLGK